MTPADAVHTAFHDPGSTSYRVVHSLVGALILVSIALVGVELSVDHPPDWLGWVNLVVVSLFAIEVTLRILSFRPPELAFWSYPPAERAWKEVSGRLWFAVRPLNLIDIVCVLEILHPVFRALRAVRLLRLVRGIGFRYASPYQGLERAFIDNRYLYYAGFAALFVSVGVGGVSLWMVDRGKNPQLQTIGDGVWWALVTITTVGYGDITPSREDPMGRTIAAVLMVAGMVMLALFAGIVSNTLLGSVMALRVEQFRMSGTLGHIVICGYDEGARLLLDTLDDELNLDHTDVVIFAPGERPASVPPDYAWIQGDPTKESELDKARIPEARAVIVVGGRALLPQQADAITILTAFTIRRFLRKRPERVERRLKPLYLVAEILDHENVEHAFAAGCDEVIETRRLGFSLLSHAIQHPGTAALMSVLACAEGQNLYVGAVPSDLERPCTFRALSTALSDRGIVALGLRLPDGSDLLNPPASTAITDGCGVIYMAPKAVLT